MKGTRSMFEWEDDKLLSIDELISKADRSLSERIICDHVR